MKFITVLAVLAISSFAVAHDDPKISAAKIAELSAHRVDRLVALGKIEEAFAKKMARIEVSSISSGNATYKSIVWQTGSQPSQVELQFDHDGKPLSFKVTVGVAGPLVEWTGKSANELIENAMHYVLDNSTNATLAPYFSKFTFLTLSKGRLGAAEVALVEVSSSAQAQKLQIFVNLDGSINSTNVVP